MSELSDAQDGVSDALETLNTVTNQTIGEKDQQIAQLNTHISEQDEIIGDLQGQLRDCQAGEGGETVAESLSGVQTFPHRGDMPEYTDFPAVFADLDALGVKRIRGQVGPSTDATAMGFYKTAWEEYGIKSFLTIGEPRRPLTDAQKTSIETKLKDLGSDAIDSIYGWNEPDHQRNDTDPPTTNWVRDTVAHQKWLAVMGKRNGWLVGTAQLWAGTISDPWANMAKLKAAGQTKDDYDIIGYHLYPGNTTTAAEVATRYGRTESELRKALADTDSPFACTEYGWSIAPKAGTSGAVRLTDEERAKRVPLVVDYHVQHGNRHSMFELRCSPDPSQADREKWLGIVLVGGQRTLSFKAYHDFIESWQDA